MGLGGHSGYYGLCAENGPVEESVGMLPETRKSAVYCIARGTGLG